MSANQGAPLALLLVLLLVQLLVLLTPSEARSLPPSQPLSDDMQNANITAEEDVTWSSVSMTSSPASSSFAYPRDNSSAPTQTTMSETLRLGGHTYVIIMLSGLVLLAIAFTLGGLFHKAEAHQKADVADALLFDSKPPVSSLFHTHSTGSLL